MSFDGAKVRRLFGSHKLFCVIVCDNSPFVDAGQIMGHIRKISYFHRNLALFSWKMRTFAAHYI